MRRPLLPLAGAALLAALVGPSAAAQVAVGTGALVAVGEGARLATTLDLTAADSASFQTAVGGLDFIGTTAQLFDTPDEPQVVFDLGIAAGDTLVLGMDLAVTGVLTPGGTLDRDGHVATLAATLDGGGQVARLAAIDGDGSALGDPLVYERPYVDGEGWRMIAAPFTDTFASLNDDFHTQGATGADYPFGGPNLFGYDPSLAFGSRYVAVPDYAGAFAAGRGYFLYAYGTDPGTGLPALPTTWDVTGLEPAGTVSAPLAYGTGDAEAAWNLLGNPYAAPLDWQAVQAAGQFQASYAVWDPAANGGLGNYAFYNAAGVATGRAGRYIPQAQGFWAEATATSPSSLTFDRAWKEVDSLGVYVGRPAAVAHVQIHLAGEGLESTAPVALFLDGAAGGADVYDGAWLRPLSTDYAALFFVAPETGRPLVFDARPATADGQTLGLAVETSRGGTYTLTWPDLSTLPDSPITLTDTETGDVVDLRAQPAYTFGVAATAAPRTPGGPPEATGARSATPRFVLRLGAVTAGEGEAPPAALTLRAPAPNPVRQTAALRYGLPAAGSVRVVVYDALGRAVATLAEGERGAGWHEARLDAAGLAAGLYVVRLETAGGALVQRVTVAR